MVLYNILNTFLAGVGKVYFNQNNKGVPMLNKLMSIVLVVSLQFIFAQEGYNTNSDFSLDYTLNGHETADFPDYLNSLGAQSVLAGMDFDGDSLYEILFSMHFNFK